MEAKVTRMITMNANRISRFEKSGSRRSRPSVVMKKPAQQRGTSILSGLAGIWNENRGLTGFLPWYGVRNV